MGNFVAVFVYGGVVNHVEISENKEVLIDYISEVADGFDPVDDTIQIWDSKGNIVYNHEG